MLSEQCSTCVFLPGNVMRLSAGRLKEMVDGAIANDSAITCHQTLPYGGYDADPAVCRGFFDKYADQSAGLRLAVALGAIVEDDPPKAKCGTCGRSDGPGQPSGDKHSGCPECGWCY